LTKVSLVFESSFRSWLSSTACLILGKLHNTISCQCQLSVTFFVIQHFVVFLSISILLCTYVYT
jgi:hypothetical protein